MNETPESKLIDEKTTLEVGEEEIVPTKPLTKKEKKASMQDVARAMILEGANIIEITQETGLSKKAVWGIKGAMARDGMIKKKEEPPSKRKKIKDEAISIPTEDDEDREGDEEDEGEGLPFRRPESASDLIRDICQKYGVSKRAVRIIADRCNRVGVLHPADLERLLLDLKTGLKGREAVLIAEEYDMALRTQADEQEQRMSRRSYGTGYRTPPSTRSIRGQPYLYEEEQEPQQQSWTPKYPPTTRYGEEAPPSEVTGEDLEEMKESILEAIGEKLEKKKQEDRLDKILNEIRDQGKTIINLQNELRDVKEHPPTVEKVGESDYEKTLKHTVGQQTKKSDELGKIIREDQKTFKSDMKQIRDEHQTTIDRILKANKEDVKELREYYQREIGNKRSTEGYTSDEVRLVAEGIHEGFELLNRKKPAELLVKLVTEKDQLPAQPERERVDESNIASQVPKEMVEKGK